MKKDLEEPLALANIVQKYWVNFAYAGHPNSPGLPSWPAYKPEDPKIQLIDKDITTVNSDLEEKSLFWEEFNQHNASIFGANGMKMR